MIVYIIPIITLLLTFMALLASLRFIFSRQGLYWVFPALISLILFFLDLQTLLVVGEDEPQAVDLSFQAVAPLMLAALWYMMIIVFHYALKKAIVENSFENDSVKNRAEAEYLEKYEARIRRKSRRQRMERTENSASVPSVPEYRDPGERE